MMHPEYVLLRRIRDERCTDASFNQEEHVILRSMAKKHWIAWTTTERIVLLDAGQGALLEEDERLEHQRKQRAEEEEKARSQRSYADQQTQKQFRHDWWIAIFETLSGFILGAVADHFFDIVGHASRLWSSLFH